MRDEGSGYGWVLAISQVGQFASAAMYRGAEFQTVVGEVRSNEVMLPFENGSYRLRLVDGRLSGIGRGRNVQGWKTMPVPRNVRAEIDEDDVMARDEEHFMRSGEEEVRQPAHRRTRSQPDRYCTVLLKWDECACGESVFADSLAIMSAESKRVVGCPKCTKI